MKIVYTLTDEAPALATVSLLPIVRAFASAADVEVEVRDISLAGRILAQFPDMLDEQQRVADALGELGELAEHPDANIIKLPNISASVPQLKAAIEELQGKGYAIPDYPEEPADDEQREVRKRYDKVKGSAVNPVLRQGNSDRRAPASVKEHARQHPQSMGAWSPDSRSHVSTMSDDDFRSTERSVTVGEDGTVRIEHVDPDGNVTVLKDETPVKAGEVIDAAVMRRAALEDFLAEQLADAKERGVLFSVHLKTTMMRVSDPIIFGHVLRAYFADVFAEHGEALKSAGVNPNDGLGAMLKAIEVLPDEQRAAIEQAIDATFENGPPLAMVDSARGITNLHVPSDVIIDASMPAAIRSSGQMWNPQGELAGHEVRDPGSLLCRAVRRDGRGLPPERRVRPREDGEHAQHRADGTGGRGVRVARQDIRDRGNRVCAGRTEPTTAKRCWNTRFPLETSGVCVRPRTRRSRTGCASPSRARGRRTPPRCSGSTRRGHTTPRCCARSARRSSSSTPRGCRSRSSTSPGRRGSRSSGPATARTRSRSRATCSATT